jgi:hypothetical protein
MYGRFAVRCLELVRTEEMIEALKNFISGRVHQLLYPWMLFGFFRGRLLME